MYAAWRPCFYLVMYYFCIVMLDHACGSRPFLAMAFSNVFTDTTLNVLDLYIKYTAEVVPLHTYIVWFTPVQMLTPCSRSVNCLLTLLHFWWWTGMSMDNETFYILNVFPFTDLTLILHYSCKITTTFKMIYKCWCRYYLWWLANSGLTYEWNLT